MARMSNKRRLEWSFFLNDRSRITYNELCRKCQHECKQSFRAVVVDCPKYLSKRSKKKDKTAGNGSFLRFYLLYADRLFWCSVSVSFLSFFPLYAPLESAAVGMVFLLK